MDPFATLGAPRRFDLDLAALEKTHRDLSRTLHPDRFAQASASERRAALEKAADVNEAWRTLREPVSRAEALFRSVGVRVGETHEPQATAAFLMEVMEDREALAEARAARDLDRVRALGAAMEARAQSTEAKLAAGFAEGPPDREAALSLLPLLGELRFFKRFLDEVGAIEDEASE
jgi:molecular chaperone HscB